jgi:hypothetical protein
MVWKVSARPEISDPQDYHSLLADKLVPHSEFLTKWCRSEYDTIQGNVKWQRKQKYCC